jgi:predicted phage terminase large subunit-like protein
LGRKEGEVLWPELFTKKFLNDTKAPMVESRWESLYQGSPVASEGNILQRKWIKYYQHPPRLKSGDPENSSAQFSNLPAYLRRAGDPENPSGKISNLLTQNPFHRIRTVISVDSAEKDTVRADFSAIQCWVLASDYKHYLMDSLRGKFEFPALVTQIENMATKWGADIILCETKGAGNQYVQARTGKAPCAVIGYNPGRDDKIIRFEGTMVMWQAGEVLLPERAPWLQPYIDQLLRFPAGKNDDDVDATSQYLNWSRADGGWKRGMRKVRT